MNISAIGDLILDETSSPEALGDALNAFALLCGDLGGIRPDPSFSAWAKDSLLDNGVAINPQAAAHCVLDHQRSVVFIRGVYAAIKALQHRFANTPLEVLYAGCGPYATLLLPLLERFSPGLLNITLLDIHQRSLDSVECLLDQLGYNAHAVRLIKDDACHYTHPNKLHLVIAETMQKSLEQEPQFAVTTNLAPQLLPTGVFVPQCIEVELCLADLKYEQELLAQTKQTNPAVHSKRYPLATLCSLPPLHITQPKPVTVELPQVEGIAQLDAALFTRICVFEQYNLGDYESHITLPHRCHELAPLAGGDCYRVSYQMGSYPKFNFERL